MIFLPYDQCEPIDDGHYIVVSCAGGIATAYCVPVLPYGRMPTSKMIAGSGDWFVPMRFKRLESAYRYVEENKLWIKRSFATRVL